MLTSCLMQKQKPEALDGNFIKVLYINKCQSVLYLSVKFQVDRPENKEDTIFIPLLYHNNKFV